MHRGYIKIWRKTMDSGLLLMPNTLAVFIYILMNASHKQIKVGTKTGFVTLERGQYISGLFKLSEELEQSVQNIRTSLERLKDAEILTIKSTNKYSIYTIVNYDKYQNSSDEVTSNLTNNQQTSNKQVTTKQELEELKKEKPLAFSDKKPSHQAIEFDWSSGEFTNINGQLEIWKKAYPAIDVDAQLKVMAAWIVGNPKNKKSSYGRFINSWLSRSQDKAPTVQRQSNDNKVVL